VRYSRRRVGNSMKSEFLMAVTQLAAERSLPREMVISAVEAALISAYKKDSACAGQDITVRLDPNTGDVSVFQLKTVVDEVADELKEMTLREAKKLRPSEPELQMGDVLEFEMPPQVAGRIAAQTAKQVVIQRLREAERELVYGEFSEREGEVFTGTVQRSDARYGGVVTLDLNGRAEAIIPPSEQAPFERYRPGLKIKVIILEVRRTNRGPEIVVSRTHPELLRRLFEMEVPEIYNGIVEIRAIAREPGSRSKVAVAAKQEGVDPVGACVGLRGIRIQNIVNELQGEKIDVVQWYRDPAVFISHALSPAQPLRVELDQATETSTVVVSDRSLSLAIGREGQNARLAAKLTGWKVDIKSSTELEIERMKLAIEGQVAEQEAAQRAVGEMSTAVAEPEPVVEPAAEEDGVSSDDKPKSAVPPVLAEVDVIENAETVLADAPALNEATDMAVLEAEIQAEEAAARLSAEEELVLESLGLATGVRAEVVEEIVEEVEVGGDEEGIWKVAKPADDRSQIRFAEDIAGAPIGGRQGTRGRRRGGRSSSNRRTPGAGVRRTPGDSARGADTGPRPRVGDPPSEPVE
jgi:N utilization substance protein A